MAKYLDSNGLLYLWGKIKGAMPKKTSDLTNDSGFITSNDIPEGAAASTTTPKMNGTAAVGTEMAFARGDHVHPSDDTKVDKVAGKGLSTNDLTDAMKANYDAAYEHSQAAHAPVDAEKNTIVGIKKNGTALTIDAATRTVDVTVPTAVSELTNDSGYITESDLPDAYELPVATANTLGGVKVGTNVAISDGTISVANGTTSAKGVVQLTDSTNSTSTTTAATPNAVKTAYDLANSKQSPATTLGGYGITDAYTKAEIDAKVTSAVHYKGTVDTYADLPTDAVIGDMYNVTAADATNGIKAGDNVVWNGTAWDVQSGVVDLTGCIQVADVITNAEIDTIVAS